MSTISINFASDLKKWAKKTEQGLDHVVKTALIELSTEIIKRTPVGDPTFWKTRPPVGYIGGAARGNWFASTDHPVMTYNKAKIDKTGRDAIALATKESAKAAGKVYYLTNNLPYIRRIEYEAWAYAAPAGMVRVSVADFQDALTNAVKSL